jgi:VWFA-related protein
MDWQNPHDPNMLRRSIGAVASMLIATSVLTLGQQSPVPQTTFRSGVDLILIEATVLDKDGRPVADLQARDFSIKLGGKARTIAAAEYIPAGKGSAAAGGATSATPSASTPGPSTTASVDLARAQLGASNRTIILAVDVDNIRSGAGRNALVDVAEYVATLPPTDHIGIMTLPGGGTTVEPTNDRAVVRAALGRMAGADHRMTSCDATIGEAAAEAVNDDRGWDSFNRRVSLPRCPRSRDTTRRDLQVFIPMYRAQTKQTLGTLTSLAKNLGGVPGRRVIVLVAEGLYMDDEVIKDLQAFGAALERSRVVLYAIHLDFPFSEASAQFTSADTRQLDDRYGFDAMANAAGFGGGAAIRAVSQATAAITRIDRELSGTYLLGIERLPADVAGKTLELKVEVTRKGADVRSRRSVTISGK